MGKIDYKKKNIPFTQVANAVLNDAKLSFKAKGLFAYLYSKPDGWDFESGRIAEQGLDGRDSVRVGLIELEQQGYLKRYKLPNGRMVYEVCYPPMTENPSQGQKPMTEKANDGKSHSGETRRISNKENISNKDIKVIKTSDVPSQDISELIKLFEDLEISAAASRWYANTAQRSAVESLVKKFGREQVEKVVRLLPSTNKQKFMPRVTTPHQLQEKWFQLRDALIVKKQESLQNNKPKVI